MQTPLGSKLLYAGMSLIVLVAVAMAVRNNVSHTTPPHTETLPRIAKVGVTQDSHFYLYTIKGMDTLKQAGFSQFFLMLNWTADDQLVCIGDWNAVAPRVIKGYHGQTPPSLKELMAYDTITGEKPCTLVDLAAWLKTNQNMLVIDFTDRTTDALKALATRIPMFSTSIMPVVHTKEEASVARELGFQHIAFAPYRLANYPQEQIASMIIDSKPTVALLRSAQLTSDKALVDPLLAAHIPIAAYTVNDCETAKTAIAAGADGLMTDLLVPSMCK